MKPDTGQLMIIYPDGRIDKLQEGTLVSIHTAPIKLSRGRWFLRLHTPDPRVNDLLLFNARATAMMPIQMNQLCQVQQQIYGTVILDRRNEATEVVDV